jgi:hypothetical protein
MVVNGKVPRLRSFSLSPILNFWLFLKKEDLATHRVRAGRFNSHSIFYLTNYINKLVFFNMPETRLPPLSP